MNSVCSKRLVDLITFKRGYDLPEQNRIIGPYPVISSAGISGFHNDYKVEGKGVVTGRYGTLGEMYFVDGKYWPHNTALYVQDFKGNDPKYIYYLLSCLGRIRTSDKSAVPGVNRNELHEMFVPAIEEKSTQIAIRQVLETLDAKIELNDRINAELEAMAKTLYDYWFVQFDFPDANGKPYKTSGGKMVYNAELKRDVPEGWQWKPIEKLIDVRDGTHESPKPSVTGQYLITSKHLKESGIDLSDAYLISDEDFEAVNKRSKVDEGDFLLSMIGTIGLSQWVMKIETPFAIKNIGLFKTSKSPDWADYIFSSVTSDIGKFYLKQNQSTGTSQPYVTLGTLRSIPIIIPPDFIFQSFTEKVRPLHKAINVNTWESQKLCQLRDWLLPMLMNGQVTVK